MPHYELAENEQLTYATLQNVPCSDDTEYFNSICRIDLIPNDSGNSEMTMESENIWLNIIEQPADTFRYRYKSEKGSHGGIKGENNARSKKSFPTVKVENCPPHLRKKVVIKASLYTNEDYPKPHIHELAGKNTDGAKLNEDFMAIFQSIGILAKKKEEVLEILKERKRADNAYYDESSLDAEAQEEMKKINLDSARLCFEAFCTDDMNTPLCAKAFSNPINNQKSAATGDLKISRLSRCSGKCSGGDEVFMLCEKVKKEDIKVRFFEKESDWEAYAEFNPADIHHQFAIVFKTPQYHQHNGNCSLNSSRKVYLELFRPSDERSSEERPFEYIPDEDPMNRKLNTQASSLIKNVCSRKRRRTSFENSESSSIDLNNSSVMYSPSSSIDDEQKPLFDPDLFNGIDLNGIEFGEELFSELSDLRCVMHVDNQNLPVEGQMGYSFPTNLMSKAYPQDDIQNLVKTDGVNEISNSMGVLSLVDKCCKQEGGESEIHKTYNEFAIGMKRVLQNRDERTYLHYASHLMSLQDEDANSLLHLGIMEQNENWNFISKMVKMASEDLINHQNKFKETPLHLAVKGNYVEILILLLARGGDPNLSDRNGDNCLHLAAKYGHIKCLKVLLPSSESIKTWKHRIIDIDMLNYEGLSALHIAVTGNFADCASFLLDSKADVNLPEKKGGRTPLHLAVEHPSVLPTILKHPNVDIDAEDFGGYTAVQLACLNTGKSFEAVSAQLNDTDEIIKFFESLSQNEEDCDSRCCDVELSEESSDSSDFEDAVEAFSPVSSSGVVCRTDSSPKLTFRNGKKSSLMKTEEELYGYLDRDENWKKLAFLISDRVDDIALLDEGLSPGQTVLRKIKDLYHPCQSTTIIEFLKVVGLEEGAHILQKNS